MKKSIGIGLLVLGCITTGIWYGLQQTSKDKDPAVLCVGTNPHYQPFEFIEHDQLMGFDIDLMQEIAHRLGKKLEWHTMTFDALIPAAQVGQIHIIAAAMTPTAERAKRLYFTKPHIVGDQLMIITLTASPIKNLAELKGKTVVVNEGYTADYFMSEIKDIDLIRLQTVADAFMALQSKRADAFVTATQSVKPFFDRYGKENFVLTPIEKTSESYALGISKQYPELVTIVQTILNQLEQEGFITTLKQTWGIHL